MYLPVGQWQQAEKHEEYNAVITLYVFVGVSGWYLAFPFFKEKPQEAQP